MGQKKKILLIEDVKEVRTMVSTRLRAHGYDVVAAKDGQEGITKVEKEKPDLVITDLALPKMTGNVIVRILKKSPQYKHIPIIMLSAFVHEDMGKAVEVPADVYMPKPFEGEVLVGKVEELLGGKTA
ncbi:MAG: response regulator [Candidatus Omnitrophica bacterium]|nr:response regulator [Candidatus Omnitrophota bacterium]